MQRPSLLTAVSKLALDGERAGFTVEQLIELLEAGIPVASLLELVRWRLEMKARTAAPNCVSGNWVM